MGLLSVLLGMAGCDPQRIAELEEGVATEADVRARFGEPEKIWEAADLAANPFPGAAAQPFAVARSWLATPWAVSPWLWL